MTLENAAREVPPHITTQGIMQHEQSSPHQHGSLMPALATGFLLTDDDEPLEDAALVVDGGIVAKMLIWFVVLCFLPYMYVISPSSVARLLGLLTSMMDCIGPVTPLSILRNP